MLKILLIFVLVLSIMSFLALVILGFFFYKLAISRGNKEFLVGDPALATSNPEGGPFNRAKYKEEQAAWRAEHQTEKVEIVSADGLHLRGLFIPGKDATHKTMLLVHGYSGDAEEMTTYAKYYYDTYGCNILMPASRGHGESDGEYIGMGWPDRKDYLLWITYLIERIGVESEIALHGVSMGGATVMMISGEQLPPQVKFIVEDCGYSDVQRLFNYQLKRLYKLPAFPLIPITSLITKIQAGFSFKEASSVAQVRKATVPMIFIHGDEDAFVPFEMVYDVYEAASVPKELIIVKGAQHGNSFMVDSATPEQKIRKTIDSYMTKYMQP